MSRKPSIAIAALLLVAGCASEHPAPYDCDVDPSIRPLGRKVLPFIDSVEALPATLSDECSTRGAMLGDDMDRFGENLHDESDKTAAHFRYLGNGFGRDCGERVDNMAEELEFHGDRMREDAHCFWARAWHALKMIE